MPYYFLLSHYYYKLNIIITHQQCDYDFPSFNTVTVRSKEPKSVNAFDFIFTFFRTDLIQSEASWKPSSTSDWLMSAWKNVS